MVKNQFINHTANIIIPIILTYQYQRCIKAVLASSKKRRNIDLYFRRIVISSDGNMTM